MSRVLVLCALTGAFLFAVPAPAAGAPTYTPPVDAPVADTFRLPDGPYGAGNRGLEYATSPGDPVRAIGDGLVVFAGPVAGNLAVTVLHLDGLRSSYSYLAEVLVDVGQRVGQGEVLGWAGAMFHLGVRAGGTYVDPATLFRPTSVHLVPVDQPGTTTPEAAARTKLRSSDVVTRAWGWLTGAVTLAARS